MVRFRQVRSKSGRDFIRVCFKTAVYTAVLEDLKQALTLICGRTLTLLSLYLFFYSEFTDAKIKLGVFWTPDFKKTVEVQCDSAAEYICQHVCQKVNTCEIEEGFCWNCAGTMNRTLNRFFLEIRDHIFSIISNEQPSKEIHFKEVIEFLLKGNFVSFDTQSIFNFLTPFQSHDIMEGFQRLCYPTETTVVYWEVVAPSRKLIRPFFISCTNSESTRFWRPITETEITEGFQN